MPYVTQAVRPVLKEHERSPADVGELNYVLTYTVLKYMSRRTVNYALLNEIVGVLESVKTEFQRRVVAPYEDQKIKENGDVYL